VRDRLVSGNTDLSGQRTADAGLKGCFVIGKAIGMGQDPVL